MHRYSEEENKDIIDELVNQIKCHEKTQISINYLISKIKKLESEIEKVKSLKEDLKHKDIQLAFLKDELESYKQSKAMIYDEEENDDSQNDENKKSTGNTSYCEHAILCENLKQELIKEREYSTFLRKKIDQTFSFKVGLG